MTKRENCRACRAAGEKLFIKGDKCSLPSCPFQKRSYAPGQAGAKVRRRRASDYSVQLKEKQKARAIYGIGEKQMANYFKKARKTKSETGNKIVQLLETRVDNVVFRASWASSRREARQMVTHGKITLNGGIVKSPSCQVKKDDEISTAKKSERKMELPKWLSQDKLGLKAVVTSLPVKEDIQGSFNEQLIIEYYSR